MNPKFRLKALMPLCSPMLAQLSKKELRQNHDLARQGDRLLAAVRDFDRLIESSDCRNENQKSKGIK